MSGIYCVGNKIISYKRKRVHIYRSYTFGNTLFFLRYTSIYKGGGLEVSFMKQVFIFMKPVLILIPNMKVAFLNKTFESVVLPWGRWRYYPRFHFPPPSP
jgi:hypothetical protein